MHRHQRHIIALLLLLAVLGATSVLDAAWAQEESGESGGDQTPTATTPGTGEGSSEEGDAEGGDPEEGAPD
jgi:hypothetical protein